MCMYAPAVQLYTRGQGWQLCPPLPPLKNIWTTAPIILKEPFPPPEKNKLYSERPLAEVSLYTAVEHWHLQTVILRMTVSQRAVWASFHTRYGKLSLCMQSVSWWSHHFQLVTVLPFKEHLCNFQYANIVIRRLVQMFSVYVCIKDSIFIMFIARQKLTSKVWWTVICTYVYCLFIGSACSKHVHGHRITLYWKPWEESQTLLRYVCIDWNGFCFCVDSRIHVKVPERSAGQPSIR